MTTARRVKCMALMATCNFFAPDLLPRCLATETEMVPPITFRERYCFAAPGRCPLLRAAAALGGRVGPQLEVLLTLPIVVAEQLAPRGSTRD